MKVRYAILSGEEKKPIVFQLFCLKGLLNVKIIVFQNEIFEIL